jgi:hypothetical protein
VPSLDVGGTVLTTGLATVSAVGGALAGRDIVLEVDSRELARANAVGLARSPQATRMTTKVLVPATATVTAVG